MSIEIHPDCQRRLTERLATVLPQILVHNGKFLDYDSASALTGLDSTLPEGGNQTAFRQATLDDESHAARSPERGEREFMRARIALGRRPARAKLRPAAWTTTT